MRSGPLARSQLRGRLALLRISNLELPGFAISVTPKPRTIFRQNLAHAIVTGRSTNPHYLSRSPWSNGQRPSTARHARLQLQLSNSSQSLRILACWAANHAPTAPVRVTAKILRCAEVAAIADLSSGPEIKGELETFIQD